jgi:hypothetical protein
MFGENRTDPDASGGLGSVQPGLWGLLTGAVNTVGIPWAAKELGLQATVDSTGTTRYAGAPQKAPDATDVLGSVLRSPLVLGLVGVGLVVLVVKLVK